MNSYLSMVFLAGSLFAAVPVSSQAAPIYDFTSAPIFFGDNPVTVGFLFTTNTTILIDALGFYDDNQNGLQTSHEVGIFDLNGTLLTSATIQSGSAGMLDGKFRYTAISPFTLNSGQSFVIAGETNGLDGYTYGKVGTSILGLSMNPAINISQNASRYHYGQSLAYPTDYFRYDLYPMVNFNVATASVPSPATLPLLGIGLAIMGVALRRQISQCSIVHRGNGTVA